MPYQFSEADAVDYPGVVAAWAKLWNTVQRKREGKVSFTPVQECRKSFLRAIEAAAEAEVQKIRELPANAIFGPDDMRALTQRIKRIQNFAAALRDMS